MPHKVTLDDGSEIETFTPEEVEAQKKEEAERISAENQAKIDKLAEEKSELEEKLKKKEEKEMNFEKLRKKAEGKDEETESLKKQVDEINKKLNEVASQPISEFKDAFVKSKIGEDKEKINLFEYYFKMLGAQAKTKDEVQKACQEALVLVSGGQPAGNDGQVFSVGADQNYRGTPPSNTESPTFKEMASMMGNTPEDVKKYKGQ